MNPPDQNADGNQEEKKQLQKWVFQFGEMLD